MHPPGFLHIDKVAEGGFVIGDLDFEARDFVFNGVAALLHLAEFDGVEARGRGLGGISLRRCALRGWRRRRRGISGGNWGGPAALLAPEVVLVVTGVNVDPAVLHFDHASGQFVDEIAVVRNEPRRCRCTPVKRSAGHPWRACPGGWWARRAA